MTLNTYEVQNKLEQDQPVEVRFNSRVTGHNSGQTYLVGGIHPQGLLVKRMGDNGEGGVLCPVEELVEVR